MNKLRKPQNNAVSSQETRAASLRLNSEASAGPLLLAFCEQQARRAAARRLLLLRRAAEHRPLLPGGGEGSAALLRLLDTRIDAAAREHAMAVQAADRLRSADSRRKRTAARRCAMRRSWKAPLPSFSPPPPLPPLLI